MAATLAAAAGLLLLVLAAASAQSPPSPTTSGCTSVLVSLSPCLNYISGNESAAPAACCAQLGKVAGSDPQCLCVALGADTAALGLSVNRTRALGLPGDCKVRTPPVSNCKKAAAAAPPASGSTGSKTTPSSSTTTTPAENGASPRGSAGMAAAAAVLAVAAI